METGGLEFRTSSTQFKASLGFLELKKKREGEKKERGREEKKETRKERERME